MSVEDKLRRLRVRRGQIKAQCTRALSTLTSDAVHDMSLTQLSERKAKVQLTWSQFDQVQSEIEVLQDSAEFADTHENERKDFEEAYYDIMAKFQDLIIVNNAVNVPLIQAQSVAVNHNQTPARNLRLPKIDLPSFSGVYEEWYPFHGTFQSLIHRDTSINEIQKFHYLKSSLKEEAAEIIQSLEISSENYNEAWQMLKRRYDNKRLIIQKHIKALFELQPVTKENHAGLRHLLDGVLKHIRALKAIGRPTESWDDLIIHLITGKLDHITNKEWENSITESDIPNLQRLTEFLEHRCHMLQAINRKIQPSSYSQVKLTQARVSSLVSSNTASCQKCKENHPIYACEQFLKLSPEERQKVVKEKKLELHEGLITHGENLQINQLQDLRQAT
ncbi:uncharacterized protein LOC120357324 [Solenopsis invicta]|uniref:uncharacterized protein LOC120357324 n=1 Tax=Solenopsis invicta TaxID=13686 RepID=UPI00193D4650|nr:uncharacterized protein LOC120357324 [Solenopsis invicta]